jgi:endonuclease YncB( thermonuclease family)
MKIKQIIVIILIIVSGVFYFNLTDADSDREIRRVIRILDGDTIELNGGEKTRLLGLNAPETSMDFGEDTTGFLEESIGGKLIEIESSGTDKYRRLLAHIFINGKHINKEILERGLGTLYYYEKDQHYTALKEAEANARGKELGIWKKSPNENCIELIEFKTDEPERLILRNNCNFDMDIMFKDDASHIYEKTIEKNSIITEITSHVWNTNGDSLYVRDSKGLVLFHRY